MGTLFLLNDVATNLDDDHMIVGQSQEKPSKQGEKQSIQIASNVQKYIGRIDLIVASPLPRLSKLLHHLRTKSSKGRLASVEMILADNLKERNFGVLTGSQHSLQSDIFSHTRICAEDGESIAQVRERTSKFVLHVCEQNKKVIMVSHPFACQILSNYLLQKKHTILTKFWFEKGSMMVLDYIKGKFGLTWSFKDAIHLISETHFSCDEIYQELLS